ncbi:MAG: SDR family NAD(P)-dependent oxidoreductase [Eubacteriales bacterium]|jgi:NAD(P)-dependent dehydrogenase (short-subunit alcohol dehydrogenase family)|nr:SDR family NAD(P)-dependent oxidoreductase [Eubacteriales bacterium]MDD3863983.1 SDR family NAD(P)-dependent oxidoreductase [Eubacteriales bacterium]MDD4445136.1 SDR family NAD(P)-dependent oxidoreductase [Eubacteriales bacterium]
MKTEQRVAVVTGGATGIGKGCVLKFLEHGYKVMTTGRRLDKLQELAEEAKSDDLKFFQGDVSDQTQVRSLIDQTVAAWGRIDVMVNNAGICTSVPFIDMTLEQYDEVIKVNQYGCFFGMQAAARKMIELEIKGVIMNVSSVFYEVASPKIIHYHASKGAISMMSKSAALELAPYGIRVLAVAPGVIDTPMLDIDKERGTWDEIQTKHMRNKALSTEEVAEVMVFLCSEKANGVNGCVIPIDDGLLSKY